MGNTRTVKYLILISLWLFCMGIPENQNKEDF